MTSTLNPTDPNPAALPEYPMPRAAGCPFDPPPLLGRLQAEAPIAKVRLWDGSTPWLVTRYADQRALLADPRISADVSHRHYPFVSAGAAVRARSAQGFINMDDPQHARLRRMVTAPFSVKRIKALRPVIQQIVDGLIDDLLAGPRPTDLVEAFALPVPSLVICELLGVPYADHDFFQANSRILIRRTTPPEEGLAATQRLLDHLDRLVVDKMASPGDDLLSDAVEELLRYLTIVHSGRRRVATADIEVDGVTVRAGDGVILANDIGNRDPVAFPDPDRLDIHRDARGHVAFGFGVHQCLGQNLARVELEVVYGTLYRRIPSLRLAPEVTDLDEVLFKHDGLVYGVYELPVTWGDSEQPGDR